MSPKFGSKDNVWPHRPGEIKSDDSGAPIANGLRLRIPALNGNRTSKAGFVEWIGAGEKYFQKGGCAALLILWTARGENRDLSDPNEFERLWSSPTFAGAKVR